MAETPEKRGRGRPRKYPQIVSETTLSPAEKRAVHTSGPNRSKLIVVVITILLVAVGLLAWKYIDASKDLEKLSNSKSSSQLKDDEIINKVSKIALVPTDEKPTIKEISVNDASKLKGNPLFDQVQTGDKLLSYPKSGRTVVYRPSNNQIVTIVTVPAEGSSEPTQ